MTPDLTRTNAKELSSTNLALRLTEINRKNGGLKFFFSQIRTRIGKIRLSAAYLTLVRTGYRILHSFVVEN